jgi:hypothetical protein
VTPYEFVIVRYMHDAFAGELVNIGVVFLDAAGRRLLWRYNPKYARLGQTYANFDGQGFRRVVSLLESLAARARVEHGLDGGEDMYPREPVRLKALLCKLFPADTPCLQTSEVFGGVADVPERQFGELFVELIDRTDASAPRARRDDEEIWGRVEALLRERDLLRRLVTGAVLASKHYEQRFRASWSNGVTQYLEPVSMDYLNGQEVIDVAMRWVGRLADLSRAAEFKFTAVVSPPPIEDLRSYFDRAVGILRDAEQVREVVSEDKFEGFLAEIERDLAEHGA